MAISLWLLVHSQFHSSMICSIWNGYVCVHMIFKFQQSNNIFHYTNTTRSLYQDLVGWVVMAEKDELEEVLIHAYDVHGFYSSAVWHKLSLFVAKWQIYLSVIIIFLTLEMVPCIMLWENGPPTLRNNILLLLSSHNISLVLVHFGIYHHLQIQELCG
jgi:hypothetical protein